VVIKTYRVVFQGLLTRETTFRESMERLGVESETVDRMLSTAPVPIKQGLTLREARVYAEAVQEAGGRVCIREHGEVVEGENAPTAPPVRPLKSFTRCPECGLKQEWAATCARCGCRLGQEPAS
jgi:hypothetical protein